MDLLFNNYEINRSIPSDFTSTLCLLINNLYLRNDGLTETITAKEPEEVFNCYLSIINYCYIIYNNIWNAYEAKVEQNQFGMSFD